MNIFFEYVLYICVYIFIIYVYLIKLKKNMNKLVNFKLYFFLIYEY